MELTKKMLIRFSIKFLLLLVMGLINPMLQRMQKAQTLISSCHSQLCPAVATGR